MTIVDNSVDNLWITSSRSVPQGSRGQSANGLVVPQIPPISLKG